jgi:hypothetical protein
MDSLINYTVFYGVQVVGEFRYLWEVRELIKVDNDIYQGGYVYLHRPKITNKHWFRVDGTPVLNPDVPKELRALALLLNI